MYHGEGDRTQYRTNYIIHFLNMEKVLETRGIKIKAADGAYAGPVGNVVMALGALD